MYIPPKRRRRILQVQLLRHEGRSLRQIGRRLGVSHATVRSDLQLLETHWSEIAGPAADDFLLQLLHLLGHRLVALLQEDVYARYADQLAPQEYIRFQRAHTAELAVLLRETRHAIQAIHQHAPQRRSEAAQIQAELEQHLAALDSPTDQDHPKPSTIDHSEATIPQPQQELVDSEEAQGDAETIHPDQPAEERDEAELVAFISQLEEQVRAKFAADPPAHAFPDAAGGG